MARRVAKGRRPRFARDPETDKLLSMVMNLAAEVAVLRERLDTIERVAEARGLFTQAEIEAFKADDAVDQARERLRAEFLDRLLWIMREELDRAEEGT